MATSLIVNVKSSSLLLNDCHYCAPSQLMRKIVALQCTNDDDDEVLFVWKIRALLCALEICDMGLASSLPDSYISLSPTPGVFQGTKLRLIEENQEVTRLDN